MGDQELSMGKLEEIALAFGESLRRVQIQGGEPTLYTHIYHAISLFSENKKTDVAVITNGLAGSRIMGICHMFEGEENIRWIVSLNGWGALHDESKGVPGAFDKAMGSIKFMKSYGFRVNIQFMPCNENMCDLDAVREFAETKCDGFLICHPVRGFKFGKDMAWTIPDNQTIYNLQMQNVSKNPINKWSHEILCKALRDEKLLPCWGGRSMIHIDPSGKIRPCGFTDWGSVEVGEIINGGLWRNFFTKKILAETVPDKCMYTESGLCNSAGVGWTLRGSLPLILKETPWKILISDVLVWIFSKIKKHLSGWIKR